MSANVGAAGRFRPGHAALTEVFQELEYDTGALFRATHLPQRGSREDAVWLDKGEWLSLAETAGAQRLLFINDEPLIVFCTLQDGASSERQLEAFRRVWCMARPQRLFMALSDELRVYSLNRSPAASVEEWDRLDPLVVIRDAAEVASRLQDYRRARLEAGRLPADDRFGSADQRADKHLLRDLREIRQLLIAEGLQMRFAHSLIGRSIFIRYLEDRRVLTPAFFEGVAAFHPTWEALLHEPPDDVPAPAAHRCYDRILLDKAFTYACFDALSAHFNGDIFPSSPEEQEAVQPLHLARLRDFLLGKGLGAQRRLLFWAYDFSIVPIELISNIYEEFYHEVGTYADSAARDEKGTYYTPPALVEFMLGQVLTEARLEERPRVLDPACGSGIFLVEAFRRMVRFRVRQLGRPLAPEELRNLLRNRLVGVDINSEAARIAAFSLCLALLHYQEPPDILAARLPNLLHDPRHLDDSNYFHSIYATDAFALTASERDTLIGRVASQKAFLGRAEAKALLDLPDRLDVEGRFDVVIGNPPWSEVGTGLPLLWAKTQNRPVGDRSFSQLFIHRAISLARPGAAIGLLVHSSVLSNQRTTSRQFRTAWLSMVRIRAVINFVQVRRLFFGKSVAPFVFLYFEPGAGAPEPFPYITVRPSAAVERLRAVVLSKGDRRMVQQTDLAARDYLWQTYMHGGYGDAALLARLDMEDRLADVLKDDVPPGYGFQRGPRRPSAFLRQTRVLASRKLQWYGPLRSEWFEDPPTGTKREPDERLYSGQRLLVTQGSKGAHGPYIRLEDQELSFRHTIYSIPLRTQSISRAQIILAILWSSLGRYRMFMTSGALTGWYDKTVVNDLLSMPIRFPKPDSPLEREIIRVVAALRAWEPPQLSLLAPQTNEQLQPPQDLLEALDTAIFALFELEDYERDLVTDFVLYGLSIIAQGPSAPAFAPLPPVETEGRVPRRRAAEPGVQRHPLTAYIEAFLDWWEPHLQPDGEFSWTVVHPEGVQMLAIVFSTEEKGFAPDGLLSTDEGAWREVLTKCAAVLRQPIAERLFVDAIIRAVTPTDIIVVKRDEQRLWTRSMAREDAEATFLRAMLASETKAPVPAR